MDDTSTGEVFKLALTWLAECKCVEDLLNNPNPWLPTRLLDLTDLKPKISKDIYTTNNSKKEGRESIYKSRNDHPDEKVVRLVETKTEIQTSKFYYVTLSHKWGNIEGKNPLKLTKANLAEFKGGLKLKDLPKTFRNVIGFAARLHNVQYIWIDSLCIIQDSSEDWLIESSQMHRVYSLSFLNISATAAEHSHQGLYSKRNPRLLWETEINLNIEGLPGSKAEKELPDKPREYIRRCTLVDASYCESLVNQATVNKRGWVLQERLLAPRVLHFCQGQIAWECPEHTAAEGLPPTVPSFQRRRDDTLFAEIPLKGLEPLLHGKTLRENRLRNSPEPDPHLMHDPVSKKRIYALEIWNRVVEMYCKTELSFGKDKLPALSGIANRMSESISCEYVAGLWDWNLPSQLLWKVEPVLQRTSNGVRFIHSGKRAREHKSGKMIYRAPSFSWASIDSHESDHTTCGEVTDQDILVKMESAVISQSDEQKRDSFGQILGGHVTLWGFIFKVSLYEKQPNRYAWKFEPGNLDEDGFLVPKGLWEEDHANTYLDCPDDDNIEHHILGSDGIYYLPVARGERLDSEDGKYMIGLLLQRELCTPRIHGFGTFRRIGLTKLSPWADKYAHRFLSQRTKAIGHDGNRKASDGGQQLLYMV